MTRAAANQVDGAAAHSPPSVPHSPCPRLQAPVLHLYISGSLVRGRIDGEISHDLAIASPMGRSMRSRQMERAGALRVTGPRQPHAPSRVELVCSGDPERIKIRPEGSIRAGRCTVSGPSWSAWPASAGQSQGSPRGLPVHGRAACADVGDPSSAVRRIGATKARGKHAHRRPDHGGPVSRPHGSEQAHARHGGTITCDVADRCDAAGERCRQRRKVASLTRGAVSTRSAMT
jgi:hypothetical protein